MRRVILCAFFGPFAHAAGCVGFKYGAPHIRADGAFSFGFMIGAVWLMLVLHAMHRDVPFFGRPTNRAYHPRDGGQ